MSFLDAIKMSYILSLMSDMNIIVKKSIANNEILSSELGVNVGFGIRLQSYTVTNIELYNYDISAK